MPMTEAQKFAEAIRASFKTSILELDSAGKTTKKASTPTVSRAITRRNVRGDKDKEEAPREAKEVKVEPASIIADMPLTPLVSNFETLTLCNVESDDSSKPSLSSSNSICTSGGTLACNLHATVDPNATSCDTENGLPTPRGRSKHRCGRYEDEDEDLEEGVVVLLSHAPRRVTFEEGVKPRMLEVHRGPLTHAGKKMYLGNDISLASAKEQDILHDITERKKAESKVKTVVNEGIGGVKRLRKVSIKKAVRQWMHELA